MVFTSLFFLFMFLPALLVIYYFPGMRKFRNLILLLFSIFFYAWGEPKLVFLLLLSAFVTYLIALFMDKTQNQVIRKILLVVGVTFLLLFLMYFKYYDFFIDNINGIFKTDIALKNIILPIGISFYTFQLISYVADAYLSKIKVDHNIINILMYTSMFPQLIAGPIVKYSDIENVINDKKRETVEKFATGVLRFVKGMAKKVIIADALAVPAMYAFNPDNNISVAMAWIGVIAYGFQIYFDFSGYSDMAIGLGKMFGFTFPENFNFPYKAKSISDFWRRWHMTLGGWFREYVYIPLGGNRKSKILNLRNLFIVWFLTGMWHGASWNFILWGLWFGVFIALERLEIFKKVILNVPVIKYVYAFSIAMFGWVFFASPDVQAIIEYFKIMFGMTEAVFYLPQEASYIMEYRAEYIIAIIYSLGVFGFVENKIKENKFGKVIMTLIYGVLAIITLSFVVASTFSPFIYFQF